MADLEHGVLNTAETISEPGLVSNRFTAAATILAPYLISPNLSCTGPAKLDLPASFSGTIRDAPGRTSVKPSSSIPWRGG